MIKVIKIFKWQPQLNIMKNIFFLIIIMRTFLFSYLYYERFKNLMIRIIELRRENPRKISTILLPLMCVLTGKDRYGDKIPTGYMIHTTFIIVQNIYNNKGSYA